MKFGPFCRKCGTSICDCAACKGTPLLCTDCDTEPMTAAQVKAHGNLGDAHVKLNTEDWAALRKNLAETGGKA